MQPTHEVADGAEGEDQPEVHGGGPHSPGADATRTVCSQDGITVFSRHKVVKPSTEGQRSYIRTLLDNDITFCTGPAGTGKTYLAVAVAVSMLRAKQIRRIILARPAVEAGERLGFLPGDLQAKVNPYLRPLFDALEDMMDFAQMRKFLDLDVIEIIPLAFMRGRTLNESVVICDEAQNTSALQMLMVLTRLGHGSKMIITGDITQIDLDATERSGLVEAMEILNGIEGIGVVELAPHRHRPPSPGPEHRGRLREAAAHGPAAQGRPGPYQGLVPGWPMIVVHVNPECKDLKVSEPALKTLVRAVCRRFGVTRAGW